MMSCDVTVSAALHVHHAPRIYEDIVKNLDENKTVMKTTVVLSL